MYAWQLLTVIWQFYWLQICLVLQIFNYSLRMNLRRILQILYGAKNCLHAFGYNSAEVNRFGWNLEQCEPNVRGWPWHILGTIRARRAVATVWEAAEIFWPVNNARLHRFNVGQILRYSNTTTSIGVPVKTFGTNFWKFYHKGGFSKTTQKLLTKFPGLATSGRHNSAHWLQMPKIHYQMVPYGMPSFHCYR